MPPKPTCICGTCTKCRNREAQRRYWNGLSPEQRRAHVAKRPKEPVRARDRQRHHARKSDAEYVAKRKARGMVNDAIRDGRMTRGACEVCSAPNAQAHHDDYSRPFAVRWLCSMHHADEHRRAA